MPTHTLLRLLPPPSILARPLKLVPHALQATLLEAAMQHVLEAAITDGSLDALDGRLLGIEVSDLGLRWVVVLRGRRLAVCAPATVAEATVRGSATDLLLLASRLEDADTLFFQRRLRLTGDTELGLTARNLLDQLPWESVPAPLRIALEKAAQLARALRDAQSAH
ncbi:MAG: SCP2 sterol-binding domain-containing protein [Gammaproteobacteria bacterium]|jgi:predicted lipid carrier protein YhbT|nr:SCP2 sterol-binding domain-containing protein [Gammaproteobacteria bacterium]